MSTDSYKSPLDQVLNFIPQGHEKAIKQSIYNVVALCFVLLGVGAAMAVYLILQPFLRPLVWAVLIGSVLHPAKKSAVNYLCTSLKNIQEQKTPLIFGIFLLPVNVIDKLADACVAVFLRRIFILAFIGGAGLIIILVYSYVPLDVFYLVKDSIGTVINLLSAIASYLSFTMLLLTASTLLLTLIWTNPSGADVNKILWKISSHLFWLALSCHCVGLLGTFQSFLTPVICLAFITSLLVTAVKDGFFGASDKNNDLTSSDKVEDLSPVVNALDASAESCDSPEETDDQKTDESHKLPPIEQKVNRDVPCTPKTSAPPKTLSSLNGKKKSGDSWTFIYYVLFMCVIIQLYRHPSLLHFVPFLGMLFLVKKTLCFLYHLQVVSEYVSRLWMVCDWFQKRRELLIPPPVFHFFEIVWKIDRTIVSLVISQIDSIVTAGVLCLVLGLGSVVAFVLGVQLYAESVHLVQVTAGLANSTLAKYPEAQQMLPKGIDSMMEQVVDNAYVYGREGITTMIRSVVKEENANTAQLEGQALELWDRIYQSWLVSHGAPAMITDEKVPASAILSSVGNILENLKKTSDLSAAGKPNGKKKPPLLRRLTSELLNVTFLMDFAKQNVGTLMSVVDSLWAVAKANFSIIFNILTTVLTMIAGGGTAILNFVINRIIFLTALFYLLASSGNTYKPVELISSFSPGTGLTLGTAIEEAVNTVCLASLKMSLFYGLWTWFNHTVFQAGLVIMPSVLAAVLSAVPVLGHYWAALPAAIELWLAQDRPTDAALLVVFQILPLMYVDTAIYSEIKGGGHPYLTGLSIAGGILCFGIEGAIFGPLLLCCLLVAIRMYTSLVAESPINPFRSAQRRFVRMDTVG